MRRKIVVWPDVASSIALLVLDKDQSTFIHSSRNAVIGNESPNEVAEPKAEPVIDQMIRIRELEIRPAIARNAYRVQGRDLRLSFVDFGDNKHNHAHDVKGTSDNFHGEAKWMTLENRPQRHQTQRVHDEKFDRPNHPGNHVTFRKTPIQQIVLLNHYRNQSKGSRRTVHGCVVQPRIPPVPFRYPSIVYAQRRVFASGVVGDVNRRARRKEKEKDVGIQVEPPNHEHQIPFVGFHVSKAHNEETKEGKHANWVRHALL